MVWWMVSYSTFVRKIKQRNTKANPDCMEEVIICINGYRKDRFLQSKKSGLHEEEPEILTGGMEILYFLYWKTLTKWFSSLVSGLIILSN